MASLIATNDIAVIVGTGISGRSVARYFQNINQAFVFVDTREQPPQIETLREEFDGVHVETGELNEDTLLSASRIVVSPGVSLALPALQKAKASGVPVIGDVSLFLAANTAPVIAITGSNAKSTVTSLVGYMAEQAGKRVAVAGNIGTPVLDLLASNDVFDLVVLELSSFQLETIEKVGAKVATILNVSEDHMDRYENYAQYHMAKQRVYFGVEQVVVNRRDPLTRPPLAEGVQQWSFGLNAADRFGFGVVTKGGCEHLAFEFKALMPASDIKLPGRHNVENALSALALGHAFGLPMDVMLGALKTFNGLPHRCQWVSEIDGVNFYNDSKGTNVGATLAALEGLRKDSGKQVLITGGVGKGADFSPLKNALAELRALVVIGEDGDKIAALAPENTKVLSAVSMDDAVAQAASIASAGDDVLLSPACASFDMFANYEARGNAFIVAVEALAS